MPKDTHISLGIASLERRDLFGSPTTPMTALAAWEGVSGGPTASGELVNEHNAIAISTVYTCIKILSEGIASFPCRLMKRAGKGREDAYANPLYNLLAVSPNPEMTAFTFWSTMVGCSALTGNAYAQIVRDDNKVAESIWPLHPLKTEPFRQPDGTLAFKTSDGMKDGTYRVIAAADILHFPLFSMDGIKGVGPIRAARETFASARAMEKYGARFFANGAQPPSLLIRKGTPPDPKVQAEIRESWKAAHSGDNQHSQGFLFGDWDVKTIGLDPQDTQFITSRNFTRADMAAMFGIAPQYVGSLERLSNNNYTQQQLGLVIDTFRPIIVRIEQELQRKLLTGRSASKLFVFFDVTERLRGDFETQMRTLAIGRQWGILTSDEGRIELGYNPFGDEAGNARIYPVNMANMDQLPGKPTRKTLTNCLSMIRTIKMLTSNKIERRSYRMEQRAAVNGNTLTGYVAVFNSPSEDFGGYKEMLLPGCFDPLPADIPALVNHDDSNCIGRTSAGTLTLTPDDTGLGYTINLPDITVARDLKVSVERGDLPGCSFGFICLDDDYIGADDGSVLRVIRSVELIEVSVGVTFPAYTATSSQVRSLPESMPVEFRSRIEQRNKPAELVKHEEDQKLNLLTRIALEEAS